MAITPKQAEFRQRLRLSALGYCAAKAGYGVLMPRPAKPGPKNYRFDDGHYHEYEVKRRLAGWGMEFEAGLTEEAVVSLDVLPDWPVTGHLDGIVNAPQAIETDSGYKIAPGRYILEVKSMSSGPWWKFVKDGYRKAFPSYYDQIQAYLFSSVEEFEDVASRADLKDIAGLYAGLAMSEIPPAVKLYADKERVLLPEKALIVAKNKESGEARYEVVLPDEGYLESTLRRWHEADEAVAQGRIPERDHETPDNYECRDCPWFAECWDEATTQKPVTVLSDEESVEAAKAIALGKMLEKRGKELQAKHKDTLTGLIQEVSPQGSKFKAGPATVTVYDRTTTKWDHKLIEELLSKQALAQVRETTKTKVVRIETEPLSADEVRDMLTALGEEPGLLNTEEDSDG